MFMQSDTLTDFMRWTSSVAPRKQVHGKHKVLCMRLQLCTPAQQSVSDLQDHQQEIRRETLEPRFQPTSGCFFVCCHMCTSWRHASHADIPLNGTSLFLAASSYTWPSSDFCPHAPCCRTAVNPSSCSGYRGAHA